MKPNFKTVKPDKRILFICPSLVGAGVERRVCSLLESIDESRYRIQLGLLRREGDLLGEVPPEKIAFVALPKLAGLLTNTFAGCRTVLNAIFAIYQQRKMLITMGPAIVVTFTLETILPMVFCLSLLKKKILSG